VDKILTVANIKAVEKNFPDVNSLKIEKNPIARYFFNQFGLYYGSVLYFLLSIVTFLIAFLLLSWCLNLFNVTNSASISLYILFMWYFLIIGNNLFFLLKFSKIIS